MNIVNQYKINIYEKWLLHPFTKKWDSLIIYFFLKNYLLLRISN